MKAITTMLAICCFAGPWARATEMPVFFASSESAATRQTALNSELGNAGITATVFARYQDFEMAVKQSPPSLVLAPASFGEFHPEFRPALRLTRNGQSFSKGVLLALTKEGASMPADKVRLGVVQEVDRDQAPVVLSKITGKSFKTVKLVTKSEDLFPLLMFRSADLILVDEDTLPKLREKFTVNTVKSNAEVHLDNPVLFVRDEGKGLEKSIEALRALSPSALATLGFTSFKADEVKK